MRSICAALRSASVVVATALIAMLALAACSSESANKSATKKSARNKSHLVEITHVRRTTLSQARTYTGSLRARRVVRIHALEEGRITSLPYFEGDLVSRDQPILMLDRELLTTELAKAAAVRRESEANLARLRRLAKQQMVAKDELLRGQTAVDVSKAEESLLRTRVGYTKVLAPFNGVITARLAEPGDIVKRHDHVLTIADPNSLVADLNVSELLMPYLKVGDSARVRIDALGDASHPATIQRIHPVLDPATRQGRIEVHIDEPPRGVQAGQFARVSFQIRALDRQLIPFSALRRDTEGEYVFRLDDSLKVTLVRVRGGQRLANRVEVLEGLNDGDRVVTKGFLGLKSGKTVKLVGTDSGGTNASNDNAAGNAAGQAAGAPARKSPG